MLEEEVEDGTDGARGGDDSNQRDQQQRSGQSKLVPGERQHQQQPIMLRDKSVLPTADEQEDNVEALYGEHNLLFSLLNDEDRSDPVPNPTPVCSEVAHDLTPHPEAATLQGDRSLEGVRLAQPIRDRDFDELLQELADG
jgi:hypothetical protein